MIFRASVFETRKEMPLWIAFFRRQRVYAVRTTEHPANSTNDDQLVELADWVPRGGDFATMDQPDAEYKITQSRSWKEPASRVR